MAPIGGRSRTYTRPSTSASLCQLRRQDCRHVRRSGRGGRCARAWRWRGPGRRLSTRCAQWRSHHAFVRGWRQPRPARCSFFSGGPCCWPEATLHQVGVCIAAWGRRHLQALPQARQNSATERHPDGKASLRFPRCAPARSTRSLGGLCHVAEDEAAPFRSSPAGQPRDNKTSASAKRYLENFWLWILGARPSRRRPQLAQHF